VQHCGVELALTPAQIADLGRPQPVPGGHEDHSRVPIPVSAGLRGLDQGVDLARCQVFAGSRRSGAGSERQTAAGRANVHNSKSVFREATMIRNFTEHSANERTFLAWIRTGIAVIAFGFVVEKFNLFILALTSTAAADLGRAVRTDRLAGPLGRWEGVALMLVGIALIAVAGVRFVRTTRMIDASEPQGIGVRGEVTITIVLVLLVALYCLSFVVQ
jgi:putative membrane protein